MAAAEGVSGAGSALAYWLVRRIPAVKKIKLIAIDLETRDFYINAWFFSIVPPGEGLSQKQLDDCYKTQMTLELHRANMQRFLWKYRKNENQFSQQSKQSWVEIPPAVEPV